MILMIPLLFIGMIKLPKQYLNYESIPSVQASKHTVQLESKFEYEEVQWKSEEKKIPDSIVISVEDESSVESVPASDKKIEIESISKRTRTEETGPKSSKFWDRSRVEFDHSYYNNYCEPPSNIISVSSDKCAAKPIKYQSIDVNKLYCLNGELSLEFNNFMIHETLNQPVIY